MLDNRATCEAFCMNNDITPEEMRKACECVLSEWALTRPYHTNEADARRHLISTIRVRIAEQRKEARHNRRGGIPEQVQEQIKQERERASVEAANSKERAVTRAEFEQMKEAGWSSDDCRRCVGRDCRACYNRYTQRRGIDERDRDAAPLF